MEKFTFSGDDIIVSAAGLDDYIMLESGTAHSDLTVLSHAALSAPVDLFGEMSGQNNALHKITELSAAEKSTVIAGVTLSYGSIVRLSAVIAHCGELIDIADSCSVSDPYSRSNTVKIYNNGKYKIAVLVGGDARVSFIMRKISDVCSLAVCLEPEFRPENEQRIKKLSSEFSLPLLYVSPARIFFANPNAYRNRLN